MVRVMGALAREARMEPRIVEAYRDWHPRFQVESRIRELLTIVPRKHLSGLGSIVLTNVDALSHARRREKTWSGNRKVRITESLGMYHHGGQGNPAWIELLVDNICREWRDGKPPSRLSAHFHLGEVLYHEVGHHIQEVHAPQFRPKENVAEWWEERLMKKFLRRQYWHFAIFVEPITWVAERLERAFKSMLGRKRRKTIRATSDNKLAGGIRLMLAVIFLMTGPMKLLVPSLAEAWSGQLIAADIPFYALSRWTVPYVELLLGVVLALGWYVRPAAVVVVGIMAVAAYVHLVVDDPSLFPLQPSEPVIPIIVIGMCIVLLWKGAGAWSMDLRARSGR